MDNNIYKELLEIALPGYDRNKFEVMKIEIKPNEEERNKRIYLEVVHVTVEEKNIFPSHL